MPRHVVARRLLVSALALFALGTLVGCPKKAATDSGTEFIPGQKVSGRVTYEGNPVPYGVVLFYNPERSKVQGAAGAGAGGMLPIASAMLSADGTYSVPNIPTGMMMVCVYADPNGDPVSIITGPTNFAMAGGIPGPGGAGGGPPMAGGGPPMAGGGPPMDGGGPPMAGAGPPMGGGGPPMAGGGPPIAGGGPPIGGGGPPMVGAGPPAGGGGPPVGGGAPMGGKPSGFAPGKSPYTEKLTDEQRDMLTKVHEKYGTLGKSPLVYIVREGDQTYDITLPLK